jgi:hypothetical protein
VTCDPTVEQLRRWCRVATDGMAASIAAAPDSAVRAYPGWTGRDLALHVVRVYANAAIALRSGVLERPAPELALSHHAAPEALGDGVRQALREAEAALDDCPHDVVWTPVGAGPPTFWQRRLLREAVLHRWDAEQARGVPSAPDEEQVLVLIDEFLTTDVAGALAGGEHRRQGALVVRAGDHAWTVRLIDGTVDREAEDRADAATIGGEPAAVWLWLVRREERPGPVAIDDVDGHGEFFAGLIDQFARPAR